MWIVSFLQGFLMQMQIHYSIRLLLTECYRDTAMQVLQAGKMALTPKAFSKNPESVLP
jgi:hypothetical protein